MRFFGAKKPNREQKGYLHGRLFGGYKLRQEEYESFIESEDFSLLVRETSEELHISKRLASRWIKGMLGKD